MNTHSGTNQRKHKRALKGVVWFSALLALLFLGVFAFFRLTGGASFRTSMVVVGNPMHVVSWNADRTAATILDLPEDVSIDATGGYGTYAIGSLFTLDQLDHKNGRVFVSSVSDAVGLPIFWYIEGSDRSVGMTPVMLVRNIFSWGNVWKALTGQLHGTLPLLPRIAYTLAAQGVSSDAVTAVSAQNAFISASQPDGSTIRKLDTNRLDYSIDTAFLDSGLRAEGLSVAVYNTTKVPLVGQKAARVLSHLGLQLVFVGNAPADLTACSLAGSPSALKSKTAVFIRSYFHCTGEQTPNGVNSVSDLSLFLGTEYASQFVASK